MITKSGLDKTVEKLHDVAPNREDINLFYRCYFRVWGCLNVYVDSEKTRKCLECDLGRMQGLYDKAIQKWNMYVKRYGWIEKEEEE